MICIEIDLEYFEIAKRRIGAVDHGRSNTNAEAVLPRIS